ncbi:DUF2334 domain-containing protein [Exiguobacterium sp. s57]|uniref:DUF2334 domain-containing protein n=1 Tax=Exiguobacterium sp. s57 TaxID=2751258 RepID=UPI001BEC4572|nr:DUF2334 domain-containing protein [Exiguobacterium sp. s57]
MRYKMIILILVLVGIPQISFAEEPNVTIVFSSETNDIPPEVYKLDALISHFSEKIDILRDTEVSKESFNGTTHLFYFGANPTTIPESTRERINQLDAPLYGIGYSVNQLDIFNKLETTTKQGVSKFHQARTDHFLTFESADSILTVDDPASIVHASSMHNDKKQAVIVQTDEHFYSGIHNLLNRSSLLVADSLFDFFQVESSNEHLGYLRLEDINPSTDPKLLEEVGNYLLDRDVPILLAVITVYAEPGSEQLVHYTDRPELLDVIQSLEKRGASVISHGYTHQYRSSETGEGFEFWDVENNQPVLVPSNETPPLLKKREAFSNNRDYTEYVATLLEGETAYMQSKLTNSIHKLVSLDLKPLGFEAPHYTMSHSGYALTSNYFSNIFGQVQFSNTNWEVMGSTPYIAKPSLLHGMTLYPETIGYVRTDLPRPVNEMRRARDELMIVRDSMIGGFYHPYLGTEHLSDLVNMMESTPGFRWLDLREQNEWVRTENVSITATNGELTLQDDRSRVISQLSLYAPTSFLERALLVLALITFVAVLTFLLYTLYLRGQRKKRLFKERG